MSAAEYSNHQHYITEGWSKEPKESFKRLFDIISGRTDTLGLRVLDVGCATGELIGFLSSRLPEASFTGVDVGEDLIATARRLVPQAEFIVGSALDLPRSLADTYDITCAIGCMSIFDETEIEQFWTNLLQVTRPGGLVVVLSPLNEFGVDAMIRHRKRASGQPLTGKALKWETGWNVFSIETIRELMDARGLSPEFQRFELPFDLAAKPDPIRTWTIRTEARERQLTNGLKLLVDHYFIIVRRTV